MICHGCGFSVPHNKAPSDHKCFSCASRLSLDSDDLLLHGYNARPGAEVRVGQVNMARLVTEVIKEQQIALIEGPVGSGKSLAYGVPAVLAGKRVVISTAKKQLQHQIAQKDIPAIGTQLGKPVTVALLKGQTNYACRAKVGAHVPADQKKAFVEWLDKSEFGDLSDYPGKRPLFWPDVTAEDCLGVRCPMVDNCGYWRAKQQTRAAQVVVANHHVVAFDLRFGPFNILGEYDTLIIDEAHQAADAFRSAFAQSVTPFGSRRILRQMDKAAPQTGLEVALENAWKNMFKVIEHQDGEVPSDPFGAAGEETIAILEAVQTAVKKEIQENTDGSSARALEANRSALEPLWQLEKSLARPLIALRSIKEPQENEVVYITTSEKKNKTVTVAPISIGGFLGPQLHKIPSLVVTSATIAVNNSFEPIKRQLGLNYRPPAPAPATPPTGPAADPDATPKAKQIRELVLESPFDFNRQAVLYLPKHLPLPASMGAPEAERDAYLQALTMECRRLLLASGGNAFILFTSGADLREVHARLEAEDLGLPLIPQGDDAEAAFKEFQRTPRSTILGLKSFWEGVDVAGDKLRLVIITKLPFPVASDPVLLAQGRQIKAAALAKDSGEGAANSAVFQQLQVPAMITDLRQGAGRLIRTRTDKGVLAILDTRVWTGSGKKKPTPTQQVCMGYGAMVVNAIGFSQRTDQFHHVDKFLRHLQQAEQKKAK